MKWQLQLRVSLGIYTLHFNFLWLSIRSYMKPNSTNAQTSVCWPRDLDLWPVNCTSFDKWHFIRMLLWSFFSSWIGVYIKASWTIKSYAQSRQYNNMLGCVLFAGRKNYFYRNVHYTSCLRETKACSERTFILIWFKICSDWVQPFVNLNTGVLPLANAEWLAVDAWPLTTDQITNDGILSAIVLMECNATRRPS